MIETKEKNNKSLEGHFIIDKVPDGSADNSHSRVMFNVHILVILVHSFEVGIITSPSLLHATDVLHQVLGVELERKDPFVVGNEHLVLTGTGLTDASEAFGHVDHVVAMELVYFRLDVVKSVKLAQIAYISMRMRFQRNML